jgi:hypothetical protein
LIKLEDQVCSLELAKKLKELGAKQKSLFWWGRPKDLNVYGLFYTPMLFSFGEDHFDELYSAFTVAELGEILPIHFGYKWNNKMYPTGLMITKLINDWLVSYNVTGSYAPSELCIFDKTEADARAKMLIYLIENGLIKNDG